MEAIYVPNFVVRKRNNEVLDRLKLLDVLTKRLTNGVLDANIVPVMKVLAYLRPIPGVPCLNDMENILKNLLFSIHIKIGNTGESGSVDLSEAKSDFFSKNMRHNLGKLLHLQAEMKKEHKKCIDECKQYALEIYKQRNNEYVRQIIKNRRSLLLEREEIVRFQLETLSSQLAVLVKKRIASVIGEIRCNVLKIANCLVPKSDTLVILQAASDTLKLLEASNIDRKAHEVYLAISDVYKYPASPQDLIYCPDCKSSAPASPSTGRCLHEQTVLDNANENADTLDLAVPASSQKETYKEVIQNYTPKRGHGLTLKEGDTVKTKLESSDGGWRFGKKKRVFGLKKTWGFFPTCAILKKN